jgi:6-phosphogluconolactonase (cycloisomerase 2 family)
MFDLEQDKCVSRQHCALLHDNLTSTPTSVAVSPDDQIFYMVTQTGIVESYDIQAAKTRDKQSIPNQCFIKIAVDPNNQFVFIACESGNLYKYDTG